MDPNGKDPNECTDVHYTSLYGIHGCEDFITAEDYQDHVEIKAQRQNCLMRLIQNTELPRCTKVSELW